MNAMHIPDAIIELLEAHLEPKETAKAIQAIGELLAGIGDRQREGELRFVEDLKAWLSTELATKSELAGLEVRLKEEIAGVRERMAALEGRLEATATKEDLARVEGSLREEIAKVAGSLREEIAQGDAALREEILRVESSLGERVARVEGRLEGIERFLKESVATKAELAKLENRTTVYFLILLFAVVLLNQNALEFIARLIGLVK